MSSDRAQSIFICMTRAEKKQKNIERTQYFVTQNGRNKITKTFRIAHPLIPEI